MSDKYIKALRRLARMKALDAESAESLLNARAEQQDGGPGSGNFGHAGRPGKKGGSAPGKGGGGGSVSQSSSSSSGTMSPKATSFLSHIQKSAKKSETKGSGNVEKKSHSPLTFGSIEPSESERPKKNNEEEIRKKAAEAVKGVSGKIDPKKFPELFPAGGPAYTRQKHGVRLESISVVRDGDEDLIQFKWSDGSSQFKDPGDVAIMEKNAKEMNERLDKAEAYDPYEGLTEEQIAERQRLAAKEVEEEERVRELIRNGPPSGRWAPDPAPFRGSKEQAVAHYDLENNLVNTADWCFEKKKKWYEPGSIEYQAYEDAEDMFANHSYSRPSPEDSARMIQDRLSHISKQLQPSAVARYKKDMENEPQITQDVCEIADELGVQMHGLEFRTKVASDNKDGICRIQQKIEQDLADDADQAKRQGKEPTLTYDDCVRGLNDLVRYTQLGTEKNLVANYEKTRAALEKKGYKTVKVKNFYTKDPMKNPYRGLTVVFESPTGTRFEFQFHTPRSLVAKNAMHPIYEIDRNYDPRNPNGGKITEKEHENLQKRMRNVSSKEKVPYPKGIEKIQDYPPKKQ